MNISWQLLHDLEKQYGDSFYLLDLEKFQRNYQEFLEAFRNIYPNSNIAYSYKTNYLPRLCHLVNLMGGYAEVVSEMEYDLAIKVGINPERIIFNGPYKKKSDLEKALFAGSIVNLDSFYEIELVKVIAQNSLGQPLNVGIRCNFNLGSSQVSRFGFDVESDQFKSIFEVLRRLDNCCIRGLHCHFLTPQKSVQSYAFIASKMIELSDIYFNVSQLKFIDLGGGFFSKMSSELKQQFGFPVPAYQEYAEAIAPLFAKRFSGGSAPELILEPGIAITADIMKFVSKTIDIKSVRSQRIALVSGSIYNIKPTLNDKNLPIRIVSKLPPNGLGRVKETFDIVGYTCMENDCLYHSYDGFIAVNDYIVFDNVGAYTIVLKPPFIRPNPPIIAYNSTSDQFDVIKRQEELSDVFSTYNFE